MKKISIQKSLKEIVFLSTFIFSSVLVFGQKNSPIYVGIAEGAHINPKFYKTDLQIGMHFELESSSINAFGIYQLYGNMKGENFSSFLFASHLLGLGVENRTNVDKRVSLFLGANLLTEVGTNFKDGYIAGNYPSYPRVGKVNELYHSTPLASSVYIGVDIKIIENLHFNFSLENNFRFMRKRKLMMELADFEVSTFKELINEQNIETEILDKLGLRVGVNYNFSFRK